MTISQKNDIKKIDSLFGRLPGNGEDIIGGHNSHCGRDKGEILAAAKIDAGTRTVTWPPATVCYFMALAEQLKQLGLNHSETTVYLFLLENGLSTPPIVSQGTKIARTNCYNILAELKNKDLIAEQTTGKRKAYLAHDPESLLRNLERKKEVISQVLPELRGLFTTQKNKPKVRFYDGLEQIKQIYLATLEAKQIHGFTSLNKFLEAYPKFGTFYAQEMARKKVAMNDVLSHTSRASAAVEFKKIIGGLYDYRFLPTQYKEFPTDLLVWGDNVAIITLNEPAFGTILTNQTLANTFRLMHQVMWESIR